ncbi:MAG TPA: type II toxin-antitoxin system VapC family toxin [Thermoanaerobaculia bacterium]|nr:type II toxin-antitoxin system VapC family toxin [Thermoanaerobaculia bacterium]
MSDREVSPSVYIETSVISYLTARRNERDLIVAGQQQLTHEWWQSRRQDFTLYTSAVVIEEARHGNETLARTRLAVIEQLQLADVTSGARELAARLLLEFGLPAKANADALHIAVAAANGMDYLLTWNCTHLANAFMIPRVEKICRTAGFEPPYICTPQALMVG